MKYIKVDFDIHSNFGVELSIQDAKDLLAAMTGEIGFESFEETENGLIGYIQEPFFNNKSIQMLLDDFPLADACISFHSKVAEYKDWNSEWEENGYEPIIIDNKCIIHDTKHTVNENYNIDITIDAKLAFGTGTHQTTRMIVTQLLNMNITGKKVLDCGCGTGILSFVAVESGASGATGYDIDEWSVNNAIHNAELNNIISFETLLGDASLLGNKITGPFEIVIANINRNILQTDMSAFVSVMTSDATLILSGFYDEDSVLLINQAKTFYDQNKNKFIKKI